MEKNHSRFTSHDSRQGGVRAWPSGNLISVVNPRPEDIEIEDIAHHLSIEPRFAGGTPKPYSVAQHSVLVMLQLKKDGVRSHATLLQGLLHDAPEYLLKDLPKPIKQLLPAYQALEENLWEAICEKYLIETKLCAEIKQADLKLLDHELRWLNESPRRFKPWPPGEAKKIFLHHFRRLSVPDTEQPITNN